MRILIIADEVWNDDIHGNNVLTNWFLDFPAEFAEIYCSPGEPLNKCCRKYFQITDSMMAKSIIGGAKAGKELNYKDYPQNDTLKKGEQENKKFYTFMKKIKGNFLRLVREEIWLLGKYDIKKLKKFIRNFDPDVIFCPRMASAKLLRLEAILQRISHKPMIAFTGDDEFSLAHICFSPFFWIRRFMIRSRMKKLIPSYSLYYTHSIQQAEEYRKVFKIPVKNLYKCGIFDENRIHTKVNQVIKITYIGRIYVNRWKTLAMMGRVIKELNRDSHKIVLEVYTKDDMTKHQRELLNDGENIILNGSCTPDEIQGIYDHSDIALHVESFDTRNMLTTRYSFSTKIIDCLASGCAVMAVCNPNQAGFDYLRKNDAALTASNEVELKKVLKSMIDDHRLIREYAKKAYCCGKQLHNKEKTQKMLYDDFTNVIVSYNGDIK